MCGKESESGRGATAALSLVCEAVFDRAHDIVAVSLGHARVVDDVGAQLDLLQFGERLFGETVQVLAELRGG